MSEQFFKEVVAPLIQMRDCVLAAISSMGDSTNFFSRILTKRDSRGKLAFNVIHYSLACAKCMKTSNPQKCTHKLGEIPPWQSEDRKEVAHLMLEDDGGIANAELMGGIEDAESRVFTSNQVRELEDRGHIKVQREVSHIFVAMDPNGGGTSLAAIASGYTDGANIVIAGLESRSCLAKDQQIALLVRHIKKLRNVPQFSRSLLVLQIECNLGYESDWLYGEVLNRLPEETNRIVAMRETDKRIGGRTTENSKAAMAMLFLDCISNQGVFFLDPIIATEEDGARMKSCVMKQLGNYTKKSSMSGKSFVYTGKVNGANDDVLIAVQMLLYYRNIFVRDTKRYGHLLSWTPGG